MGSTLRWRLFLALLLITSSLLAACGGGTKDSASGTTQQPQSPPAQTAEPAAATKAQLASPTMLEAMLEETIKAAFEGKWAEANKNTINPDAASEASEKVWKSILSNYYKDDATKIPITRVMGVIREEAAADLKVITPASKDVKVKVANKDGQWVIVQFGDFDL